MLKRELSQDYSRLTPYHQETIMAMFGSASFQQTPPNAPDGIYNAAKEKTNKLYPYLAKIKNGNDFLYLAATKTPGRYKSPKNIQNTHAISVLIYIMLYIFLTCSFLA